VIYPDWIDAMVEQAQRPSIGAVGALLRYPDKIIQHAGVVVGIGHFAAHSHRMASETDPGYYGQIVSISNYSAVTAACLMCRREVFAQVGGFDEQLAVAYNDVDFCLKIVEQGYRNIYLPHVVLYHYESKSRGYDTTPDKVERFMREVTITRQRWQRYVDHDPCYNPNLTLSASDYSLRRFAEVEISKIALDFDRNKLQDCSIDQPEMGTYWGISQITFKGWVLAKQEKITTVQVIGNHGQVIKEIPANFPRTDVNLLHPENPNSEFCGFCETIELKNLSEQTELLFQAVLKDGTYAKFAKVKISYSNSI
ncbi:MAG: glycosyltransferase family 2 protein, partial [Planktothrix sp.]